MWIYYREQCEYCKNQKDCEYIQKAQELMKHLDLVERQYKGVYGTLKWTCDYFNFDEEKYFKANLGECPE